MTETLIRRARVTGHDGPVDVLLRDGVIAAIGSGTPAGEVLDADSRWLLPGFWDAHVHFTQWVVRRQRVDLAPATSAAEAVAIMREALARRDDDVLLGYGFRDGLWPDAPSRAALARSLRTAPSS
ncbi:amidohydrolase family protein [Rathayibacter sp. VKM Ac-2630]|uniref:amidohydrolase family protein n=1 Tax=Rathayibacter sp. VKM Ac-2630 TaxID=1938617 RepID=UPI002678191D